MILYLCCCNSITGLILQNQMIPAVDFMFRHPDCFYDVIILSSVATASQFFISYTIRTFGALTFATIMTTRQLVSILLSCVWFVHPLSWMQWVGAAIVFGALYTKSFLRSKPQKPAAANPSNSANNSWPNDIRCLAAPDQTPKSWCEIWMKTSWWVNWTTGCRVVLTWSSEGSRVIRLLA